MAPKTQHMNTGKTRTAPSGALRGLGCIALGLLVAACSSPSDSNMGDSNTGESVPGSPSTTDSTNPSASQTTTGASTLPGSPSASTSGTGTEPVPSSTNPGDPDPTDPTSTTEPSTPDPTSPTSTNPEPDPTGTGTDPGPITEPTTPADYPPPTSLPDEDGSELWLRYRQVPLDDLRAQYQAAFSNVVHSTDESATLAAAEEELVLGLGGLTGSDVSVVAEPSEQGSVVLGTPTTSPLVAALGLDADLVAVGNEGYVVRRTESEGKALTVVAANSSIGVLYGSFALLRHLQSHRPIDALALEGAPKIQNRILDHWDNLDGSVERGYAGRSLWAWGELPATLSPRYKAYARANASIGVNGVVLTNVNANAQVLTAMYLDKVAALAEVFRAYGIKVYLTARFSAPSEIGGLSTSDPAQDSVKQWWVDKADEIYALIPDFGGFLVKANSEGQPGPQEYGRTHADGANALADAVNPHGGIVMWRAFVYSDSSPTDRIRQAYDEFEPLDGQFHENVLVQVKNGPLDFQPREPFSPLFGAMPETPLALEVQITKEYLGEDTHLAYLGPLYEEVLKADTFAAGEGSTVARVIDGSLHGYKTTVMAGVANIGTDTNWSGSHFNQANWYVFGRMAWDPDVTAQAIAEEWVRQTLSNDPVVLTPVTEMMMSSREALVDYMTPLGLAHIMGTDHHYGPKPWENSLSRAEWNPTYYHKASPESLGFDRTVGGSDAVSQYSDAVRDRFGSRDTVPDEFLLFFHKVGWQETLGTGRTLWDELVYRYSRGVDAVGAMREAWKSVEGRVDAQRFAEVNEFLEIQHYEARWWRDACLTYFQSFADLTVASEFAPPANDLGYYQGLTCPSNASKPRCDAVYTGEPSPALLQPAN